MKPVTNENAYAFIAELIEMTHEGFHGTSYEMTEALFEIDASLFTGEFDGDNDESDSDPHEWHENHRIMEALYNRVAYAMICVVADYTKRKVEHSTQNLSLRSCMSPATSPDIVSAILDDLCAGMIAWDAETPFTREFFERRRNTTIGVD